MKKTGALKKSIVAILLVILLFEQMPITNVFAADDTDNPEEEESMYDEDDMKESSEDVDEEYYSADESSSEQEFTDDTSEDSTRSNNDESYSVNENTAEKTDEENMNTDSDSETDNTDKSSDEKKVTTEDQYDNDSEETKESESPVSENTVSENTVSENTAEQEEDIVEDIVEDVTKNELYETPIDDSWYENYEYVLNDEGEGNTITLTKYEGTACDTLYIPSMVTIEGVEYSVFLRGPVFRGEFKDRSYSGTDTKEIIFADGVSFSENISGMFAACTKIESIIFGKINSNRTTNMSYMFDQCSSIEELDLSCFNTSSVTDMSGMFRNCMSLKKVDVSCFDTSKVTNMRDMFNYCISLSELDVSGFDTGNVISMYGAFSSLHNLQTLDVSGFNTKNVEDMHAMFSCCYSLTKLEVDGFDTGNVQDMSSMFFECESITYLDIRNFDTKKVKKLSLMFYGCEKLAIIDVSNWDTSNVTVINNMFEGCNSINDLDLSSFDLSLVTNGTNFVSDMSLKQIKTPKNVPENMIISLESDYYDCNGEIYTVLPHGIKSQNSTILMKGFSAGDGSENNPYIISTSDQLYYFADSVNGGQKYYGKYIALSNDIYLNNIDDFDSWSDDVTPLNEWPGINGFTGTFDGNGYSIYGLYMKSDGDNVGFFNYFTNTASNLDESNKLKATVKNLHIDKCYISGKSNVGGIAGSAGYVYIYNCSVDGKIKGTGNSIGGFVGKCGSPGHRGTRIYSSVNSSAIEGKDKVGGFIGYGYIGNDYIMHMGQPDSWEYNGGTEMIVIDGCTNYGKVKSSDSEAGGLIGYIDCYFNCGGILISKSQNFGNVVGADNTGGIAGYLYYEDRYNEEINNKVNITECCNAGNVWGHEYVGGIVGKSYGKYSGYVTISDVYNVGTVTGSKNAAGIIGSLEDGFLISRYLNVGYVSVNGGTGSALIATGSMEDKSYSCNSYYLSGSGLKGIFNDGIETNSEEMKKLSTYSDWDFENVWQMGEAHPIFKWQDDEKIKTIECQTDLSSEEIYVGSYSFDRQTYSMGNLVSETPSNIYNPKLAYILAAMMWAAYDPTKMVNTYQSMGYDYRLYEYYPDPDDPDYGEDNVAYSFAHKETEDGTIVLVCIRGSYGASDWRSNFLPLVYNLHDSSTFSVQVGFDNASNKVYSRLDEYISSNNISKSNATFVLTGHSRGAGVANLVSYKLINDGISKRKVYDYNFACPDVAMESPAAWNWDNKYDCIFNISNVEDPVAVLPGAAWSVVFKYNVCMQKYWGKYGTTRFFAIGSDNTELNWENHEHILSFAAHESDLYVKCMSNEWELSKFKTWEESRVFTAHFQGFCKIIGILCPVDVEIVNEEGNVVTTIIGQDVTYYDDSDDILVFIDGDEKVIYIANDNRYTLNFIGTDNGEMTYVVSPLYPDGDNQAVVEYSQVELYEGREMHSYIGGDIEIEEIELLDENETQVYYHNLILGDVNLDDKLNAADRIYIARYLAGWSGCTMENEDAADVNRDGKVNAADRIYLARYLAGWSGYVL